MNCQLWSLYCWQKTFLHYLDIFCDLRVLGNMCPDWFRFRIFFTAISINTPSPAMHGHSLLTLPHGPWIIWNFTNSKSLGFVSGSGNSELTAALRSSWLASIVHNQQNVGMCQTLFLPFNGVVMSNNLSKNMFLSKFKLENPCTKIRTIRWHTCRSSNVKLINVLSRFDCLVIMVVFFNLACMWAQA